MARSQALRHMETLLARRPTAADTLRELRHVSKLTGASPYPKP